MNPTQKEEVVSYDLCETLHELNVRYKCQYGWFYNVRKQEFILKPFEPFRNLIRTYTLRELGEMIPFGSMSADPAIKIGRHEWTLKNAERMVPFTKEVDVRAWYLITLIKSNKVSVEEINKG